MSSYSLVDTCCSNHSHLTQCTATVWILSACFTAVRMMIWCFYINLCVRLSVCLTPVNVWLCVWQLPVPCVFRWRAEPHLRALPRSLRNHHHQHLPGGNNDQYLQRNRALARLSQVPREGTQGLIDYGEVLRGLSGRGPSFCIEVPRGLSGREPRVCGEVLGGLSGRVLGCVRETPGILSMLRGIPGIYHIPRR